MKKRNLFVLFSALWFLLSGCATNHDPSTPNPDSHAPSFDSTSVRDPDDDHTDIQGDFQMTSDIAGGYEVTNHIYTITQAGEYTCQGKLENGKIVVNAPTLKVTIRLTGVSMTSAMDSLIEIIDADKVTIKAIDGTYNELIDQRAKKVSDDETTGSGCIYADADLDIGGSGSLVVSSTYNHGIHTKKDLDIKKVTMKVTAVNHALKGNDSITIHSGNLTLISKLGNGMKTTNTDISTKGNQRGTIFIEGGNINVYSACDAIDAAYNVQIDDIESPSIYIYTDKYSPYSEEVLDTAKECLYLRVNANYYSTSYRYAAYFYADDIVNGIWQNATEMSRSDNRYYYYQITLPSSYTNVRFYRFLTQDENSLTNYNACSEGGTLNAAKDMFSIRSIRDQKINGDWSNYGTAQGGPGGPGGSSGNTNKSEYSTKGVKADNEILITGGILIIEANDDGIHVNQGTLLENGKTGLGNLTITGGNLQIFSTDDGIHADQNATFSNAYINILSSYEGIEANQITFISGTYIVRASDDGINASTGTLSPSILVQGGKVDVTVGSGDTDGIDSNGSYEQTGGFVISRCGAQGAGGNASALDLDGSCTITGGTFVHVGSAAIDPSSFSLCSAVFGSISGGMGGGGGWWASSNVSFSAGEYAISGTDISFQLDITYQNMWICSEQLAIQQNYQLSNGTTTYSWSQTAKSVTVS